LSLQFNDLTKHCAPRDVCFFTTEVCTGFDPCANASTAPHCHSLARCVYVGPNMTRCQCPVGYRGDGVNSCEMEDPQSSKNCAENNGGCSANAICRESRNSASNPVDISCNCKPNFAG